MNRHPANYPSVTVLVCTSNRAALLDSMLTALEAGSSLPDQLVIVNGEDGATPAVVAAHAAKFERVVLIEHPNRHLATLRNLGLPHCDSDVVAMTDDDALPDADWIERIRAAHLANPDAGAIGGAVRGMSNGLLDKLSDAVVFPRPRPGRRIETLPTVNMSYPRTVMAEVGEFDPSLFRGEDVDFNWRVLGTGRSIIFDPHIRVRHRHRNTVRGFLDQQWMYGRAYVLVRHKWPSMYAVYPHSLGTPRAWAKVAYSGLAIVMHPLRQASRLGTTGDRLRAFPLLVLHHLVWKAVMIRQALGRDVPIQNQVETVRVTRWVGGRPARDS